MPDEEESGSNEVEFIDAKSDAEYRLQCLSLALQTRGSTSDHEALLEIAKSYYDWVMDVESTGDPSAAAPEEPCKPRPH